MSGRLVALRSGMDAVRSWWYFDSGPGSFRGAQTVSWRGRSGGSNNLMTEWCGWIRRECVYTGYFKSRLRLGQRSDQACDCLGRYVRGEYGRGALRWCGRCGRRRPGAWVWARWRWQLLCVRYFARQSLLRGEREVKSTLANDLFLAKYDRDGNFFGGKRAGYSANMRALCGGCDGELLCEGRMGPIRRLLGANERDEVGWSRRQ